MNAADVEKTIRNSRIVVFVIFLLTIIFGILMLNQGLVDFIGFFYRLVMGIIVLLIIIFIILPLLKKHWKNKPPSVGISRKKQAGIAISITVIVVLVFIFGITSVVLLLFGLHGIIFGESFPIHQFNPKYTMPENVSPEFIAYFSQLFTLGGIITLIVTILLVYILYRIMKNKSISCDHILSSCQRLESTQFVFNTSPSSARLSLKNV